MPKARTYTKADNPSNRWFCITRPIRHDVVLPDFDAFALAIFTYLLRMSEIITNLAAKLVVFKFTDMIDKEKPLEPIALPIEMTLKICNVKRLILTIVCIISLTQAYAQSNIRFNGATFGTNVKTFMRDFCKGDDSGYRKAKPDDLYNSSLYNGYCGSTTINSEKWNFRALSSRETDTVFKTTCTHTYSSDIQENLMLLVKILEGKYGRPREENKPDLGYIQDGTNKYKEMSAFIFLIKNTNNKTIGEIRLSCAPKGSGGLVQLSYTDSDADKKATQEYNNIVNSIF